MNIRLISKLLMSVSAIVMIYALTMNTSVETEYGSRVVNLGLQQSQTMFLMLGGILFIAGIILFATWKMKQTPEEEAAFKVERETAVLQQIKGMQTFSNRSLSWCKQWVAARPNLLGRLLISMYVGALLSPDFYSMTLYAIVDKIDGENASIPSEFPTEAILLIAIVFLYSLRAIPDTKVVKQLLIFNIVTTALYGIGEVLLLSTSNLKDIGEVYAQLHSNLIIASIALVIFSSVLTLVISKLYK